MTGFADDATATGIGVARPMFRRHGASVDRHDEGLRFAHGFEQCFGPDDVRREAAVEADHEYKSDPAIRPGDPNRLLDLGDFLGSDREWFLDEHVLPSL